MEPPWGGPKLQETFRCGNIQGEPQHDGVAAVTAAALGWGDGSERREVLLLVLGSAETRARMCPLGFHLGEGCSAARVEL